MQSSPFLAKLRTTFHPSSAEASQIQEIILGCEANLDQITVKITRAQEVVNQSCPETNERARLMNQLRLDQDETRTFLEAHRSLLSPVRRLPPEMLAKIFMHCLPHDKFIKPAWLQAPLLLGQICAVWRNVAFSTPRLWSSLDMDPGITDKNRVMLVETWLSRTGMCPLSLSLRRLVGLEDPILNAFSRYALRWQHILLTLPHWKDLTLPLGHLLHLETLQLHTPDGISESQTQQLSVVLRSAPRLREMAWDNNTGIQGSRIELPWAQLNSLILTMPLSVSRCLDILYQSQNLEHFSWEGEMLSSNLSHFQHAILLPRLSSLTIPSEQSLHFLDHLTCPILREITFCSQTPQLDNWSQLSFLSLLGRSRCALERLHIHYASISELELIECLQRTNTSLVELTVQTWGAVIATDNFLTILTHQHSNNTPSVCLSPKLEMLALYDCISPSEGAFAKMVESRLRCRGGGSCPIHSTSLKVVETFNDHVDIPRLKEFRKEGLTLKLYHHNGDLLDE